jgi:hypothetical protein
MDAFGTVLPFATALAVLVTALVQLVKKTFKIPKNYIPLIGLGIGLLIGWAAYPFTDLETVRRVWAGGFAGLGATGLFELLQNRPGTTKEK